LEHYARALAVAGPALVVATAVVDDRWVDHPIALILVLFAVGLLRFAPVRLSKFSYLTQIGIPSLVAAIATPPSVALLGLTGGVFLADLVLIRKPLQVSAVNAGREALGFAVAVGFYALALDLSGARALSLDFMAPFVVLAGTYFVCGASTNGLIGTHLIPACMDHGFTAVTGAALLATMGVFNFIGTTSSGWLADKFDNRWLLFTYYALRGLSLIYLPFSFVDFYTMTLFAMFYGLDWFATVSPTVRILTNTFGRERAGMIYGWIFTAHQLGGASAAFFGGLLRVEYGGYMEAFMLSGALCLGAAIAVLFIGRGRSAPERAAPAAAAA